MTGIPIYNVSPVCQPICWFYGCMWSKYVMLYVAWNFSFHDWLSLYSLIYYESPFSLS